jgi:hypothetical protein
MYLYLARVASTTAASPSYVHTTIYHEAETYAHAAGMQHSAGKKRTHKPHSPRASAELLA